MHDHRNTKQIVQGSINRELRCKQGVSVEDPPKLAYSRARAHPFVPFHSLLTFQPSAHQIDPYFIINRTGNILFILISLKVRRRRGIR